MTRWIPGVFVIIAIPLTAGYNRVPESLQPIDPGELQAADETVLVQLGRMNAYSFRAGIYLEYALNNLGDRAVTIVLTPETGALIIWPNLQPQICKLPAGLLKIPLEKRYNVAQMSILSRPLEQL